MWSELLTGFGLGNAAILTNVCLLPLYPGLIAFLAGNNTEGRSKWVTRLLGLVVLAGVLTMMLFIGLLLHLLSVQSGDVLFVVLPVAYGLVILLGLFMLSGRNPFARLTTLQAPMLGNPFVTAYVYGLLLGPMTLPCTGPILVSAFAFGLGDGGSLGAEIAYVLAYGLGFGWPLVVLPFFAVEAQRMFTRALAQRHTLLTRVAGVLLVGIGVVGIATELVPNIG
jgi:cytochrome c-type biogenesis protein